MNLIVTPKRSSKKPTLYYLKQDGEIIKRSFRKKRLLALKQKLEEGIIDIEDVRYQNILEKDITKWESEYDEKK